MNFIEFINKLPLEDRQLVIDHFIKAIHGHNKDKELIIRRTATISTLGTEEEKMHEISQIFNVPIDQIKKQNIAEKLKNIKESYHQTASIIDTYKEFLSSNNAPKDKFDELYDLGKFLISLNLNCNLEIPVQLSAVPDFIIVSNNKRIGVEHTRLMNRESQILIKRTNHIIKKAESLLHKRNPELKQIVNISINYWKLTINNKKLLSKLSIIEKDRIAMTIVNYIECLLNNENVVKPEYIDRVAISNRPEHSLSLILNENYIAKPDLEKLFEERIKNKEEKISSYLKNSLDELWLLIVISGVTASSSYILQHQKQFDTQFDKVFLFDNFSKEYLLIHSKT